MKSRTMRNVLLAFFGILSIPLVYQGYTSHLESTYRVLDVPCEIVKAELPESTGRLGVVARCNNEDVFVPGLRTLAYFAVGKQKGLTCSVPRSEKTRPSCSEVEDSWNAFRYKDAYITPPLEKLAGDCNAVSLAFWKTGGQEPRDYLGVMFLCRGKKHFEASLKLVDQFVKGRTRAECREHSLLGFERFTCSIID